MKFRQITIVLLGLFFSIIAIGCNTGTIRDYSYDEYENIEAWRLSNDSSVLSIHDYIVFDGGHSIQIINDGCGSLRLIEPPEIEVFPYQEYEVSVTVRRAPTGYDENAEVNPEEASPSGFIDESFSIIIMQAGATLLSEEADIEFDFTWETNTFTFVPETDTPLTLSFRLGCDLKLLWIDSIKIQRPQNL